MGEKRFDPELIDVDGFVTNYVVIFEYVDTDGERHLDVETSEGMTPWLAEGMVSLGTEQMEDMGLLSTNE